jgi:hypothetical protein
MAGMDSPNEKTFPLLALPPEIRLTIYCYVFTIPAWHEHRNSCAVSARDATCPHCGPCSVLNTLSNPPLYPPARILIDGRGTRFLPWSTPMAAARKCFPEWPSIVASWPSERTAILRTCKAIYGEARDVLYNDTLFVVQVSFCSEHIRRALGLPYPRDDTFPISFPSQLQQSRHLAVELQIHSHSDIRSFLSYLFALGDTLPATHRLKSKTVTLNFEGLERHMPIPGLSSAPWKEFAHAVSRVASDTELRLISGPRLAEQGKEEHELLANAAGGRIKFLGPGKKLCEGSNHPSPLHQSRRLANREL